MDILELNIEESKNIIWGGVNYNDNLIVAKARTLNSLEQKMKALLLDFEGVDPMSICFNLKHITP